MRWGTMRIAGIGRGKWRKPGSRAVAMGIKRSRLLWWGFMRADKSRVVNIIVRKAAKRTTSR